MRQIKHEHFKSFTSCSPSILLTEHPPSRSHPPLLSLGCRSRSHPLHLTLLCFPSLHLYTFPPRILKCLPVSVSTVLARARICVCLHTTPFIMLVDVSRSLSHDLKRTRRRIYFKRLDISCDCRCEMRTTRHRAAPASQTTRRPGCPTLRLRRRSYT